MEGKKKSNLLQQLIDRTEKVINDNPVTEYDVIESKVHEPLAFLNKFAKKELVLMHRFSATRIIEALHSIFNVTDVVLRKKQTWTFPKVNRLAIYYTLAASCCNYRPLTSNEEVADQSLGRQIIEQSRIIFGNEFGAWTHHIQRSFEAFLGAIGSHSYLIFNFFLNSYQQDTFNNITMKQSVIALRPWTYMLASVDSASNFLKPLASNINLITKNYREPFSQMITKTLTKAFKRNPSAFSDFLTRRQDIMIVTSIIEQISSWDTPQNPYTWPTQAALSILQPAAFLNCDDITKIPLLNSLRSFQTFKGNCQKYAIQAILIFFQAFTASNAHDLTKNFVERYFAPFLNLYLNDSIDIQGEYHKILKIDFPLASLMLNAKIFKESILPKIITNDLQNMIFFAKIIKRFCKIANPFPDFSSKFIEYIISPAHTLIQNLEQDPKNIVYLKDLVAANQYYPNFMRNLLFEYPDCCKVLFNFVENSPEIVQEFSYINFFDPKYVEETPFNTKVFIVYESFIDFVYKKYSNETLYKSTTFGEKIPAIVDNIAESLLQYLQIYQDIDEKQAKYFCSMITNLESMALIFLTSSKSNVRYIGIDVLKDVVEIVHIADVFQCLQIPDNNYQLLITEARRETHFKSGSKTISNYLKTIDKPTAGITQAYEALFPYFMALSKRINSNIVLLQPSKKNVDISIEVATEEWIGVCSVIFAIAFDQVIILFQQMKLFLQDGTDIGQYAITGIPQAIAQRHYSALITIILGYFRPLVDADNTFIVTPSNILFVSNILRLTRGICEQKTYWSHEMINVFKPQGNKRRSDSKSPPETMFGQLAKKVVSFCDVTQGEDCKLMCIKLLIAIVKLCKEKERPLAPMTRHSLGKTILTWLPQNDDYSHEFIKDTYTALALLLDDLSLMECIESDDPKVAEQQFMFYFASIKTRLDRSPNDVSMIIPVLASLLKQNLSIAIGHCISMGFEKNNNVRNAFIASVAAVFKIPESKVVDNDTAEQQETTLIDILFDNTFDLVELVGMKIPYTRAEAFAKAALGAAAIKGKAFEYLSLMIDDELSTIDDQNKNTIFRGNAVPARVVGHWPRLVGMKWLKDTLRPIFDDVIKDCETGKKGYIIDKSKIGDNEDILENQNNFRALLRRCLNAIYEGRNSMPDSLIYAAQIIYQKVYAKVGDFAKNILSSFLFLRFIIPSFSATHMVDLPPLLDDKSRAVLLQTSTALMASILKGKLSDKGDHFKTFDEDAKNIQDTIFTMFDELVKREVCHDNPEIQLDPQQINAAIHKESYGILQILETIIETESENSTTEPLIQFTQKIRQMGQPTSQSKEVAKTSVSTEADFQELMSTTFPQDQIEQLSEAIFREDHLSPDGKTIINLICNRLNSVKDPRIVAQTLFKLIIEAPTNDCIVCLFLAGFDPSKIPNATMILKYSEMPPAFRVSQYLIFEPPNEFAMFCKENPKIFENKGKKFEFIDSISKITKILGPIPETVQMSTLETFSSPQATYSVVMNGQVTKIRVHEHSLQIVNDPVTYAGHEFTPTKVIMADQIEDARRSLALKAHPDDFMLNIKMKNHFEYQMRVPLTSPLYDATISLLLRCRAIKTAISQVTVDNQTLNWLMLNLAFINLVVPTTSRSVKKASLDLIYAVYVSFDFGKSIEVQKVEEEILPDNMVNFVAEISEDLAAYNSSSVIDFLTEFFKATEYLSEDSLPPVVLYIVPWIKIYCQNPQENVEFIHKLIDTYRAMKHTDQTIFPEMIWPLFAQNEFCVREVMTYIFNADTEKQNDLIEVVTQFAQMQPELVSKIWTCEFMTNALNESSIKINIVCNVLKDLIAMHVFDFDGCVAKLIYNLALSRLKYQKMINRITAPENPLEDITKLITNVIHEIFRRSGKGKEIDIRELVLAFYSQEKSSNFREGKDNRTWPSKVHIMADIFSDILRDLGNQKIEQEIYNLFYADISSKNKLLRAQGIIYSAAFSLTPDETALYYINLLNQDPTLVGEICLGLSLINMSRELASKLFFVGCVYAMHFYEPSACDLIASAAKNFADKAGQTSTLLESVQTDLVEYISTCTALPFATYPLTSGLTIIACCTDGYHKNTLMKIASCPTEEPIAATLHVLKDKSLITPLSKEKYRENISNITAMLVMFLNKVKLQNLSEFAIALFTEHPQGLGCFDVLGKKFGATVLQTVNDPRFTGLVLRNAKVKGNEYPLTPILLQRFEEMDQIKLSKEQLDYLVGSIFPLEAVQYYREEGCDENQSFEDTESSLEQAPVEVEESFEQDETGESNEIYETGD